jgi:hypothetical protein
LGIADYLSPLQKQTSSHYHRCERQSQSGGVFVYKTEKDAPILLGRFIVMRTTGQ